MHDIKESHTYRVARNSNCADSRKKTNLIYLLPEESLSTIIDLRIQLISKFRNSIWSEILPLCIIFL